MNNKETSDVINLVSKSEWTKQIRQQIDEFNKNRECKIIVSNKRIKNWYKKNELRKVEFIVMEDGSIDALISSKSTK